MAPRIQPPHIGRVGLIGNGGPLAAYWQGQTNLSPLAVQHPVEDAAVGLVDFPLFKIYVYISDCIVPVSERMGDSILRYIKACRYGGSTMPRPVCRQLRPFWFNHLFAPTAHTFNFANLL